MSNALVRAVSPSIGSCELVHRARTPIDVARAREQHAAYCATLQRLGCRVVQLPEAPEQPDAVFVEDTALVFDELAVATRPGAASRRAEVDTVARALKELRPVVHMEGPGTLDGGDVVVLGREVFVGRSTRSDEAGIEELERLLAPHGYHVAGVELRGCLHLKSAACALSDDTLLANPDWVDPTALGARTVIEVAADEPEGANAFPVGATLVHARHFPHTRERLERAGFRVAAVDADELAKAEGAVTCCSLIVR